MKKTPEREIQNRLEILSGRLEALGIHCAILFQNTDRFYYSGTIQDGVLLVRCGGEPVLFVKRTLQRALEESSIKRTVGYEDIGEVYEYIGDHRLYTESVGLEMDTIPAKFYLGLVKTFPSLNFVDISKEVRIQRSVKSEYELNLMREGGRRLDRVLEQFRAEFRPGMTEYGLYGKMLELFCRQDAVLYVRTRSFNMEVLPVTILSGPTAALHSSMDSPSGGGEGVSVSFPAGPGHRVIGSGEPVLIDVAFNFGGYIIDCTRIFSVGKISEDKQRAHRISGQCHEIFLESARHGVSIPALCRKIAGYVDREGLSGVFMGKAKFIGHGVGLELDEFPVLSGKFNSSLKQGMTVAFEPKFIFGDGGVGYENTYHIGEIGAESFIRFDGSVQTV
jgi:Xaa-Pro dipeptidase